MRFSLLAALLAASIAIGLTACGGDSGNTAADAGTTATEGQEATQATESTEPDNSAAPEEREGGQGESTEGQNGSASQNKIRGYGEEADAAERDAASQAVETYLQAREDHAWGIVCNTLSVASRTEFEKLASGTTELNGDNCTVILNKVEKAGGTANFQNTMINPISSLRVDGDDGFAIYATEEGRELALKVVREGDEWKVNAIEPVQIA